MEQKLNLFSEFILNKYTSKDSIIEVCDSQNFIVVKGYTTNEDVISMHHVSDEFSKKYETFPIKNVIDLIEYKTEISSPTKYKFLFGKEQCNKPSLFEFSKFPYGHSWSQGKLIYFYFKHIVDRIPTSYPFTWIKFDIQITERNEILFEIEDDYLNNEKNILKSLILDCFDFDLVKFESVAKKMDLEKYILNPNDNTTIDEIVVKDFFLS